MEPKQSPIIREKKRKPTVGLPGSSVADADLGRRSGPGSDEPHEPVDFYARIANRAYELYERGGRQEGHALNNWLQAEREIRGKG
ncbi:MAG: DUF2934 domain-containing protein [Nitrospirae bacterium]|nr:DUF2934 domain-containing protein [Nitrospirota bacterium]